MRLVNRIIQQHEKTIFQKNIIGQRNLQRKKELFNFLKTYRKSLNNVKKLNEVNHYHRYLKKNTKKQLNKL